MEEASKKKNIFYLIGVICGISAIAVCLFTLGMSVGDSYISVYLLSLALFFLGVNRIGLHLNKITKNIIANILLTGVIFILSVLVGLTKYNIYFLISSLFCYSLTIIGYCFYKMKEDKSTQSIIFHVLCMVFVFLFSFVFFFPAIYAKHATSVSNSNFIVLCYALMIIISSGKNLLFPYHKTLKLNIVSNIIKKSLGREILLVLMIIVVLCSVYFTCVEENITSYVDALWYSFAVITTIGFGDVSVTTTLGRILSVILGMCGIVAVALFTSFIVNFYNEMNKKREERMIQKLIKETKEVEKIEEEILDDRKDIK